MSHADHRESDVVADNPYVYIAGDRRRSLASGVSIPGPRERIGLFFVHISGFTPLTEALAAELGPRHVGPRSLRRVLDPHFRCRARRAPPLRRERGLFQWRRRHLLARRRRRDARRGVALDMAAGNGHRPQVRTPGGQTFQIGMKVAVAAGKARRFVVGDPDVQLIDVLAGVGQWTVGQAAEHEAERGDVVVEASTFAAIEGPLPSPSWSAARSTARSLSWGALLGDPIGPLPPPSPPPVSPSIGRAPVAAAGGIRAHAGRVTAISSPSCDRQ